MKENNKQILVVDFYDSFTYNIVSECKRLLKRYHLKVDIQVCAWDNKGFFSTHNARDYQAMIWGPGPGMVSEYESLDPIIDKCLRDPNLFNLGICLGHQIILKKLGHNLIRAQRPIHGENVSISLPAWSIFPSELHGKVMHVQLYNSWVIERNIQVKDLEYLYYQDGVMSVSGLNLLTYQFHPESIGTSFPEIFFLPLINKLCNNGSI
ncbi:MAG: hypothetical protein A2202_03790 [Bdellovibrionales bacterium RIFOXYA1_FULL_36_14]|nr:MAG: hypothetical protein A2202_03790 [Bdellovibrionales bacterium RIFOXYA1_FULL_36_14]